MELFSMSAPYSMIDLTVEPKDHLTALPSELLHLIIGYLYPTHEPDKAYFEGSQNLCYVGGGPIKSASQPLDYLAATCKSLRHEVMAWSRIMLTKHSNITSYKPFKTPKLQLQRNLLRGRGGLLTWSEKNCVFCGKKSTRSAVLMNGLRCCAPCDREHWPDKITKTEAKRRYRLKDHHLLPEREFAPSLAKLLRKHPGGLPTLRYGTYISSGVSTTMFLRADVEALSALAHGDLKAHLRRTQAERDERVRKEEAKVRHQAKWNEMSANAANNPTPTAAAPVSFTNLDYELPDFFRDRFVGAWHVEDIAEKNAFDLEMEGIIGQDDPFMGINDVAPGF